MASNRNLVNQSEEDLETIFLKTTELILQSLGKDALRPERAVNAAFADALMVGVATAIKNGNTPDARRIREVREALLAEEDFLAAITTGTSQKQKVFLRIDRAIQSIGA